MLTVERLDDGEVSPYLTDVLMSGDELELRGPIGGYFIWEESLGGPLLLIAGIIQLWNPITGDQVAGPLPVTAGPVSSIAFDPSGQRFATTASQDGTVKLWTTSTLQQDGTALNTAQDAASTAVFEPGGTGLLVVNDRGDGFTWPTSLSAWEQHACAVAGRNLTPKEWSRYLPGQAYTNVCP